MNLDEKRFQELHKKYGNLLDGPVPPERREYAEECWRRKAEELERKKAAQTKTE